VVGRLASLILDASPNSLACLHAFGRDRVALMIRLDLSKQENNWDVEVMPAEILGRNAKYRTRDPGPVVQRSCNVLSSASSEKRSIRTMSGCGGGVARPSVASRGFLPAR
jgi:hypothetical protein